MYRRALTLALTLASCSSGGGESAKRVRRVAATPKTPLPRPIIDDRAQCTIRDLGPVPEGFSPGAGKGWSLNSRGDVAGWVRRDSQNVAAFARSTGETTVIGGLADHRWSVAVSITEDGAIAGYSHAGVAGASGKLEHRAFWWRDGSFTDLGTLGGLASSALGSSRGGYVTGESSTAEGERRAYLWDGERMIDLGTLGGDFSSGRGVSATRLVTGVSSTSAGDNHAFLWDAGHMTDLGTLGGPSSSGNAVNDAGWVTGSADRQDGRAAAFLWNGERMIQLGPREGDYTSNGKAISPNGLVTGWVRQGNTTSAFLTDGQGFVILRPLPSSYDHAEGVLVDDSGTVLGRSTGSDGKGHVVRWECSFGGGSRAAGPVGGLTFQPGA